MGRVTQARTVDRVLGGSRASPIAASGQPALWRAVALAWSAGPFNARKRPISEFGSLFFDTLL